MLLPLSGDRTGARGKDERSPSLLGDILLRRFPGQDCLGPKVSLSFYLLPFLPLTQA